MLRLSQEQGAGPVADQVPTTTAHHAMSMAPPLILHSPEQMNGQREEAPASVDQALASHGRPLDHALRQDMEQRFGHDFSRVRVHSSAAAEQSAANEQAHAYTIGHDIVVGAARLAPWTHEGRRLMAHELTHVVQADTAAANPALPSTQVEALELEARQVAAVVCSGGAVPPIQGVARALSVPLRDDGPPTFGNLPLDPPEKAGARRVELVYRDGKWKEIAQGRVAPIRTASGSYDFVIQDGRIWAVRSSSRFGHTEAALGGRVSWAGRIFFTKNGDLKTWNNESGHYLPQRSFAKNAERAHPNLPIGKFDPDPKLKGPVMRPDDPYGRPAHREGPQLPVIQPQTKPRPPAPAPATESPKPGAAGGGASTQVAGTTPAKPTANIGTAAAPKSGSLTVGSVTVNYNLDPAQPKTSIKVSDINLSDYPPDRQGPVTRHFKSGPGLQQLSSGVSLTRLVASLAAQGTSDETRKKIEKIIEPIQSHFRGAIEDARKEFRAQFPAPDTLWRNSGVDQRRKAYEAAAAKLRVPQNVRVAAAVMIALANEKDREQALRVFGPKLNNIGIRPGDLLAFHDAASAYETTMADLRELLEKYEQPLPKIAADIKQRASVLQRAGNNLLDAFWSIMRSPLGGFPLVYYEALGIYNLSSVFLGLGSHMEGLADEIAAHVNGYERMEEALDRELILVGNQLNDFQIPSPRERGRAR